MFKRLVFLCVLPLVWSTGAFAQNTTQAGPSFPCSGNLLPTEAVICSDETLASLDRQLAGAYRSKLENLPAAQRTGFEASERTWVAERNRCGENKSCIGKAYQARISSLGGYASQISPPIVAQTTPPVSAGDKNFNFFRNYLVAGQGCNKLDRD